MQKRRETVKNKGLTLDQFETMKKDQDSRCAVCGKTSELELCIDHDHSCCPGIKTCGHCTRGLLCRDCNLLLGKIGDSTEWLQSAIDYLNSYSLID